ncbi:MAG: FAD-dependent oxidoreductase [Bryobacterales bacterium]|nr:FAD-dependent oxidoreductase [Bryobacterales bacterium]
MARYTATVWYSLLLVTTLSAESVQLVDVESVRATGNPASFLHTVPAAANPAEVSCDILIAGAGAGGFAAALRAADRGHTVCLTEESNWIGGQSTAGGVSALDENKFIEFAGGTRTYYQLRNGIRDYYRRNFTLSPAAAALENFNPGSCYVSQLCFEPKAGLAAHEQMLAPYKQKVRLMLRTRVYRLDVSNDAVTAALAYNFDTRTVTRIRPRWVLDATETGELLPLSGVPYSVGSEPASDTGEPHAAAQANPACVQSFTYPFAIDVRPGENHRASKPPQYERFRDSQPFSFRITYTEDFGWRGLFQYKMFGDDPPIPNNMSPGPFFSWRRLLAAKNFTGPNAPAELALINWPRQDYHDESLLDRTPLDTARILQQAKRVSLAFLHWLQTDVPRDDGKGTGYPELRLRADVMGTEDGLSKVPYIRESRRIIPKGTRVVEQDIVAAYQPGSRARWFDDSVGIGFYMVDIHPCGANERGRMMMPRPFQIPLGALMPQKLKNFLPAGKNLGVTHLTNGAFRLHPVEWNVGEAAAMFASLSISQGAMPTTATVQKELAKAGVPLVWFDDLRIDHPAFSAIHYTAIRRIYPLSRHDLHASPDAPITRAEAAAALAAYFNVATTEPVQLALNRGWMAVDHRNWFHPDLPFYWTDWREDKFPRPIPTVNFKRTGPVTRAELATRLAQ